MAIFQSIHVHLNLVITLYPVRFNVVSFSFLNLILQNMRRGRTRARDIADEDSAISTSIKRLCLDSDNSRVMSAFVPIHRQLPAVSENGKYISCLNRIFMNFHLCLL